MAFVASSIASSRWPLAKETPAWINNSSGLFSVAPPAKEMISPKQLRLNTGAVARRTLMRNGYRALPKDASDLDALRNPNDECQMPKEIGSSKSKSRYSPFWFRHLQPLLNLFSCRYTK